MSDTKKNINNTIMLAAAKYIGAGFAPNGTTAIVPYGKYMGCGLGTPRILPKIVSQMYSLPESQLQVLIG